MGRKWQAKVGLGKVDVVQPKVVAMSMATSGATCIRTKVDLWKLMVRPVAAEKSSTIDLRVRIEATSPLVTIRVSSAYWSTGHGREGTTGWQRLPRTEARLTNLCRTSATMTNK